MLDGPPTRQPHIQPDNAQPDPARLLFTLENGLRVVIQEDRFAPVVAVQMWVKAGSADETPDVAGAAHVHEHMLFKGTHSRPVGMIAAEIESSGGSINAFTTADHTVYHIVLASRHFSNGLSILADAIQNSTFDPVELDKELQVVMEEWKRGEDSPTTRAATELFETAFTRHPYGRPVIGYRQTVESLTRERVVNFYQRWYRPNNMTLVIVGDLDPQAAQEEVIRLFGSMLSTALPVRPRPPEPVQNEPRLSSVEMNVEEYYVYLGFPLPPAEHEDIFALDLLGFIVGGGESSSLVQTLQAEQELVNWTTASAYTPADAGLFIVAAAVEQQSLQVAFERILALLFEYQHRPVSGVELDRARTNLASDFIYRRETVQGQARQLGYFLTVFSDPDYEQRYVAGLAAVTPQDIQRVARRYISVATLNAVILGKTRAVCLPTTADVQELCRRYEQCAGDADLSIRTPTQRNGRPKANHAAVTTRQLDNGVRLLVKEHHSVPVIAIQAATLGGVLFETEGQAGIGNFIAGMLTRGSQRFSRLGLAETVESLAGVLNGFSGRNSLGLSGSFLTAHADLGVDIFLETLLQPTFPDDEVEKRRRELLLALKNREDDLAQVAFDLFYQTVFEAHPYRLLSLGSQASIETLSRADIADHYLRILDPQRLVLGVVGDVQTDRLIDGLGAGLSGISSTIPPSAPSPESRPDRARTVTKQTDRQQSHVILGFQGVSLDSPDSSALRVLETILSRQGGRLFYQLREQQALAYSVTAFNVEGLAPGVFGVYLGTDPEKVDQAIAAVQTELAQVRAREVGSEELDQAKKCMIGSYEISLQSNAAQAEELVFNELYGLGYDYGRTYLNRLQTVSVADIQRVANTYLRPAEQTLVIVGPTTVATVT